MGKEQDLLDASRNGHLAIIEKILNARLKKGGPLNLTSLRRLPGPNTTDPRNGFTCLHYASLNGHKNIVRLLLEHGANPNIVDHNGSSPLHLASWTGDYEMVDMLISQNNDLKTNINLKNKDNETALHSACQYGHTPVVSMLLNHGANPFVRNIHDETPLDLASQYGRLETIELLLRLRFDLLNEYLPDTSNRGGGGSPTLARHSPLHLASRNGHKAIVKLLLDLGFDVDYLTINGTALHEAVFGGKVECVKLLLEAGTDIELKNSKNQKIDELINGLNTSVAKQTKKLIKEHIHLMAASNRSNLLSPMSESISTTTTAAVSNSFCDQEDLTIVDSMLNDELMLYTGHHPHHHHSHSNSHHHSHQYDDDDDDDLLMMMDETDVQCISPPPGYTDNPEHENNDNDELDEENRKNPRELLDGVSPSSSLFSTSIFSELASIFEGHMKNSENEDQHPHHSGQEFGEMEDMKNNLTTFSFSSDHNYKRAVSSSSSNDPRNHQYLLPNNEINNKNLMASHHRSSHHHQSFDGGGGGYLLAQHHHCSNNNNNQNSNNNSQSTPNIHNNNQNKSINNTDDQSRSNSNELSMMMMMPTLMMSNSFTNSNSNHEFLSLGCSASTQSENYLHQQPQQQQPMNHQTKGSKRTVRPPKPPRRSTMESLSKSKSVENTLTVVDEPAATITTIKKQANSSDLLTMHTDINSKYHAMKSTSEKRDDFVGIDPGPNVIPSNNDEDIGEDEEDREDSASQHLNSVISNDMKKPAPKNGANNNRRKHVNNSDNCIDIHNGVTVKSIRKSNHADNPDRNIVNDQQLILNHNQTTDNDVQCFNDHDGKVVVVDEDQLIRSSITSTQSIDDFYMLYDQVARAEYEQEWQILDLVYDETTVTPNATNGDSFRCDHQGVEVSLTSQIDQQAIPASVHKFNHHDDLLPAPPSPQKAANEILDVIKPLRQKFFHQQADLVRKRKTENGNHIDQEIQSSLVPKHGQSVSSMSSCLVHHQPKKSDNSTLTEIDMIINKNEQNQNNITDIDQEGKKHSIGNWAHLIDPPNENGSFRLVCDAGVEGQAPPPVAAQRRRRKQQQKQQQEEMTRKSHQHHNRLGENNRSTTTMTTSTTGQQQSTSKEMIIEKKHSNIIQLQQQPKADLFSAYCETLKFDRKGEKENPFAGLCRGGTTPAKKKKIGGTVRTSNGANGTVACDDGNKKPWCQNDLTSTSQIDSQRSKAKKTVELSEARKSVRKQRSILSGRAESLTKLAKLSVFNGGSGDDGSDRDRPQSSATKIIDNSQQPQNDTLGSCSMITEPNNIYATLRKKRKSKSLNGDHLLSSMVEKQLNNDHRLSVSNSTKIDETASGTPLEKQNNNEKKNTGSMNGVDSQSRSLKLISVMDQGQQIYLWLQEIQLETYKMLLIQNGYDDLDFMDSNVMDDNDLIEIGIIQATHRERILLAAQQLPYRTPKLTRQEIETMTVAQWLAKLHLHQQYTDLFHKNGLIKLKNIRNIWEIELEIILEIEKIGHRRRILHSLTDFDRNSSIAQNDQDSVSSWLSESSSLQPEKKPNDRMQKDRESFSEWMEWKHTRCELINGSCQYIVHYLGSTLVRELRGIDSTRASIGKLKTLHQNSMNLVPKILLLISCQGVKFKDNNTNKLICEHEIRNIHCICQDSEDLNYFAYITKDFESDNHYCHVFMSSQTDLVTEIILTLGQAFEIAYQIVLEQYNIHAAAINSSSSTRHSDYETQSNCSSSYEAFIRSSNRLSLTEEIQHNGDHQKMVTVVGKQQPSSQPKLKAESGEQNFRKPASPINSDAMIQTSYSINDDDCLNELLSPGFSSSSSHEDLPSVKEEIFVALLVDKTDFTDGKQTTTTIGDQTTEPPRPLKAPLNSAVIEEQIYAVVDKTKKLKQQPQPQSSCLEKKSSSIEEKDPPPPSNQQDFKPIPPVRSSSNCSTASSSNNSGGSKIQKPEIKPKPPIRVASMQQQQQGQPNNPLQKPEVSPKPKILSNAQRNNTKSNTVSSLNNKPVLARYCPQQPIQNSKNKAATISSNDSGMMSHQLSSNNGQ